MLDLVGRAVAFVAALVVASGSAVAETPAEQTARGEQLAKDGRFSEAIAAFKAADAVEPRAQHACLIALAYTRREAWPQAEIFLDLCRQRATASDPLPDWVPLVESTLAQRLTTVEVAPVTIVVKPADAHAHLTASSFAPDEIFAPRTIHLGFGSHVISAVADGYIAQDVNVKVVDRTPQTITIDLKPTYVAPPPLPPPPPPPAPSRRGWVVLGGGAIVVGVAVTLDFLWLQPARDHLVHATDPAHPSSDEYDQYAPTFDRARPITLALYGIGAATVVTGGILLLLDHREHPVQVSAAPMQGGAFVSLEWRR
jgi:hypothetical protein